VIGKLLTIVNMWLLSSFQLYIRHFVISDEKVVFSSTLICLFVSRITQTTLSLRFNGPFPGEPGLAGV